jgi:hAT family C-terminal dimerisation region/Hermes transposase DNA-binding domain
VVQMCAQDFRPFNTVACAGFLTLVQYCMDVANKASGRVLATDLLPNPTTVSRNIATSRAMAVTALSTLFYDHSVGEGIGIAFTTDMYTEDYTKISYSSLTSHWIDSEFRLHCSTLGCKEFPDDKKHTAENIKDETLEMLAEYGLDNLTADENCITTDDGPANIGRLGLINCFTRLTCSDHKLGTVVTTVFNKTTQTVDGNKSKPFYRYIEDLPMTLLLVDDCKSLVQYFNQSNLQKLLTKTLKSENDTRWNSLYSMLESVKDMYDEVTTILRERRKEDKVTKIDRSLLTELLSFLLPFKVATKRLEAVKTPTVHLVIITYCELLSHCDIRSRASEISKLKAIIKAVFLENFKLHKVHVAAAFLDPRQVFRLESNPRIDPQIYQDGLQMVDLLYAKHKQRENALKVRNNQDENNDIVQPQQKKKKSLFAFEADNMPLDRPSLPSEVEKYRMTLLNDDDAQDEDFDLLKWWFNNSQFFPHLSKVARYILAIPASSAESERVFSASSNTVTQTRSQLLPENVSSLLVIKSNINLL